MSALKWVFSPCVYLETCLSVWPPNASLYASSTCRYLQLLASPFGQGFREFKKIVTAGSDTTTGSKFSSK